MGYTVLYIAFGVVALWLLGEVLLQYKARLRWRLLAFAGFLGVVFGVYLPSVIVIGVGAAAFATGQTLVTLSYRKGFAEGWAIRRPGKAGADSADDASGEDAGSGGGSRRRRKGGAPAVDPEPSDPPMAAETEAEAEQPADYGPGPEGGFDSTQVYQPVPMHDDSGEVPVYGGESAYTPNPYTSGGYEGYGAQGYGGDWAAQQQPAAAYGQQQPAAWDPSQQQPAAWDPSQQQPAAWDPSQQPQPYGYDPAAGGYADPYADPYAAQTYGYDTPAGGVWVPQQPAAEPDPAQYQPPYIPPQSHPDHPQYADPYDPYRY